MKKKYCFENAMNRIKKGSSLSLLILLSVTVYSNPMGENTDRKTGYNFLSERPLFISWPNSKRKGYSTGDCTYSLSANSEVTSGAGSGTVTVTSGEVCTWGATKEANWITLTSGQNGTGNGSVWDLYTANTAWFSKTERITIANKTYPVPPLTPDSYEGSSGNNTAAQAYTFPPPVFNHENASTLSILEANCHNLGDVDIYKINLEDGYIYSIRGALYDSDNQVAGSSYTLDTKISYSTNGTQWTYWGSSQLLNETIQGGTLYLKIEPYTRGYVGTYAARIEIKKAPATSCTYTLLPTSREVTAETGNGQINVTTAPSCFWRATSNANWITLTPGHGAGNGTVNYSYTANTAGASRTGTITIADQTYTLTQRPPPLTPDSYEGSTGNNTMDQAYTFPPPVFNYENASTLSILEANCHNVADVDFYKINLEDGYIYSIRGALNDSYNQVADSRYTLNATISYSTNGSNWIYCWNRQLQDKTVQGGTLYLKIEPNFSWYVGTYAVRIEINKTTTIGCTYTLLPTSREVTAETGNGQINVTTAPSCLWTATSNENWITLTPGQSGTGNGTVNYSYTANTTGASRTGTITIADQTYRLTQLPPPLTPDSYEGDTGNNTVEQAHTFPQLVFSHENASTLSILEANCHNVADVDFYKINLEEGYIYSIRGVLYDNQIAGSSYTLDSKISYSTNGSNWTYWGDSQLPGKTVQGGTLYLKIEPYSRGMGTYAARIEINKTTTIGCTYTLLPTSREATPETDSGQINVTIDPSCLWTATSNAYWITLTSGQSATGSGSVGYTYQANMSTYSRTGTITIADQTFSITQEGRPLIADSYEPNNTVAESYAKSITPVFTENASTVSISATCHNSTDIDIYKINLETGYSYRLNVTIYDLFNQTDKSNYTLPCKVFYSTNGSTWIRKYNLLSNIPVQARGTFYLKIEPDFLPSEGTYAAKIDINDRRVDCNPVLSLTDSEVSSEAGNGQLTVTTNPLCTSPSPWTATSNANWITLTPSQSGIGSGSVAYTYQANREMFRRTGTITIAGDIFTINQAGLPLVADRYEPNNTVAEIAQASTFTPTFTENASTVSIEPATCHDGTDIDIYKINLETRYSYTLSGVLYDTKNNQANNTNYTLDVQSFYSTDGSNWLSWGDSQLSNKTLQGETLYIKIMPRRSENTGTYAVRIDINRTICLALSLASSEVSSEAGNGQLTVTTNPSCTPSPWTATSSANWITLTSSQSGTGNASVGYSYTANGWSSRTGTITIADQTFTITQAGRPLVADSYEPNNTVAEIAQASTFTPTFTENVSTLSIEPATCHNSTDIDIYKINLEAGYSYAISGVLYDTDNNQTHHTDYTLDVQSFYSTDGSNWINWGDSQLSNLTLQRGTLYIKIIPRRNGNTGAYAARIDINRTISCRLALSLASSEVSSEAGNGQVTVTRSPLCTSPSTWAASVTSGANWITLTSGQNGTGNGTVNYSYTTNTAWASRTGTITIAGQTYTVTQLPPPLTPDSYEGSTGNNTAEQAHTFPPPVFNHENTNTLSISGANCHTIEDVDIYKINLEAGYIYTISGVLYDTDNNPTAGSDYTLNVRGFYSTNGSRWFSWEDTQLSGMRVQGTFYLKIEPHNRGEMGTYAARIDIIKAASADCFYHLWSTYREVTPETDSGQINVIADLSSCFWTATSNANWITLTSGQSATGSGSVGYSYLANRATLQRSGTITIAGQTFTITQEGRPLVADSYEPNNTIAEVEPASTFTPTFTENATTLSISPATCHNSTDIDIYKINLEAGYSYAISGALYNAPNQIDNSNYTLPGKVSYSTNGSTWIYWGNRLLPDKTLQGGILYLKIEPNSFGGVGTYAAEIEINRTVDCNLRLLLASSEVSSEAGNGQVTVTTSLSCTSPSPWTATVTSGAIWITLTSGQNGTGNGTVNYSYTANTTGASRTGTIIIAGQTYTVTQLPPPLTPDRYEGSTGNNTAEQAHTFPPPVFNHEKATLSILEANCHNLADVDIYKIILGTEYSYTISGALYDRLNQVAASSYTLDVKGSYSTNGTHWMDWGDSQLSGKTVQGGTLYLKMEPYTSGNVGTYAARIEIKKAASAGCTYTLLPTSREVTPETDSGQINVTTDPSCLWTATSNANWITLTSGQSTAGSGSVGYTYQANRATLQRSGTITIAGQTFTITQEGRPLVADSYEPNNTIAEVEPASITPTFTENATTLSISPATCHNSTDIDIYKINLEAGYSYTLSGVLYDTDNNQAHHTNYTLDVKSSYSTNGSTWIYWGNRLLPDKTLQGGTLYLKIEPNSSGDVGTYAAEIEINRAVDCNLRLLLASTEVSSEAGNGQVTVTTSPLCASPSSWTATVTSGAIWITLTSGQNGTGNGTVNYSYTANTAWASRTGTITIAGQTYTLTQLPPPLTPDRYEGSTGNNTAAQAYTFPPPVFNHEKATLSILEANCHNLADVDIYKIILGTEYSYTIRGALYDRGNQVAGSSYTLDTKISYSTNGTHWTYWGDSQLLNETVQGGTLYLKIEPYASGNVGTYAARIEIKKAAAADCTYTLLPTSREVTPETDSGQINVTTDPSCLWTATSNANWITLTSGQSTTGSGSVVYTYQANRATLQRSGTITIAGQTFTITQEGRPLVADSYEPNNTIAEVEQASTFTPTFTENATTLSISPATCHNSTDIDIYKINLEAGYSYTLSGVLYDTDNNPAHHTNYTLDVKSSYSTNGTTWNEWDQLSSPTVEGTLYLQIVPHRNGNTGTYAAKIEINRTVDCNLRLLLTSSEVSSEAGNGQVTVTTNPLCTSPSPWTATSNVHWITLTSGQNGTGHGTLGYSYTANTAWSSRTGTITIADQTYTVTQLPPLLTPDSYEGSTGNNTAAQAYTFPPPVFNYEKASTLSISEANCHNLADVDYYKIILGTEYSYTISGALYDRGNQVAGSSYTLDTKISYSTNGTHWTYWGDSQLLNETIQGGTLYLKMEPYTRGYVGTYAARIEIKKAAAAGCTYTLLTTSREVTPETDSGQINVTTAPSCLWTATSNANWITLTSGQSAIGSGSVGYTYQANRATLQRSGTITIAGQTFTITQEGRPLVADSYEPNNTVEESQAKSITPVFTENASTVSISATCHNSTDIDIYKINLETGYSYTLSGVLYDIDNNPAHYTNYTLDVQSFYSTDGSNWLYWGDRQLSNPTMQETLYIKIIPRRSGNTGTYAARIEINRIVDCSPGLLLASSEVSSEAGNGQVTVTTNPLCASPSSWTATVTSGANWITLTSGQNGTGHGTVGYSYTANTAWSSRTGTITIADMTYTMTQLPPLLTPDRYEGSTGNNTAEQAHTFPQPVFNPEKTSLLSISEANCHNLADIDFYKINLEAGYIYTISGALYDRLNQVAASSYTLDVKGSYSTNGTHWMDWGDSQLPGKTVPEGTLYLKMEPYTSGNVGTYAARIEIKKAAAAGCTYTLLTTSREVTPETDSGQINVTTDLSCLWTATSNANWITLTSGQSTTGSGSVGYTYQANRATLQRSGTITIAGQTFTITQEGRPLVADSYEPNNTVEESQAKSITPVFTENASTLSISPATCHNSTDIDIYKINLETGYSYTLSGVLYDTDNNPHHTNYTLDVQSFYSTDGSNWLYWGDRQLSNPTMQETLYIKIMPHRSGNTGSYAARIEINRIVDCSPGLLLASSEVSSEAGNGQVTVTTSPLCTSPSSWTATVTSGANWITLTSGQSATGSGSVGYTYQANTATGARTGTITIAGQTFTINQAGCPLVADRYEPNNTVEEIAQASTFTPTFIKNASSLFISPATSHNSTDIDIYKINLEAGYSYTLSGALYDRDNNPAHHTSYTLDVKGSYSTDGSNWLYWGDRQLSNPTVQGTLYIKIIPHTSGSMGTYAAKIDLSRTIACRPRFLPTSKKATSEAGHDEIPVTTNESCTWEATTSADWITLTAGLSGTGNGTVGYSYTENTAPFSRTGTITIAAQPFILTQEGISLSSDSYEPNNTAAEVSQAATFTPAFAQKESRISISPANCHQADDVDIYKINLETGYSYAVSCMLYDQSNQIDNSKYSLDARISYSTDVTNWSIEERQLQTLRVPGGTLYLKIKPFYNENRVGTYAAKIEIKITGGCTCKLSATSREATLAAGTDKIEVTAGSLCDWTATSNTDWITITSGQSGKGLGRVEYSYTENKTEASRTGTLTVAGQTFTVNQSVITGIETSGNLKIFPNPARDFVTIDFSGTTIKWATVKITNQLGQILYVQDSPNQTLEIPLKGFSSGVYFISLQGEEKIQVQKLMIK